MLRPLTESERSVGELAEPPRMSFQAASKHVRVLEDAALVRRRVDGRTHYLVWDAMTKPELLRQWLFGPQGWEMTECTNDVVAGRSYCWAWRGPAGEMLAMFGVYSEVTAPSRIVRSESFDMGCPSQAGQQVGTLVLVERGGVTMMTLTRVCPSKEARDATIASGMDQGMESGYSRLDAMRVEMLDPTGGA